MLGFNVLLLLVALAVNGHLLVDFVLFLEALEMLDALDFALELEGLGLLFLLLDALHQNGVEFFLTTAFLAFAAGLVLQLAVARALLILNLLQLFLSFLFLTVIKIDHLQL